MQSLMWTISASTPDNRNPNFVSSSQFIPYPEKISAFGFFIVSIIFKRFAI